MATGSTAVHSTQVPTQLKFHSKAASQRSFDEPLTITPHEDPLRILVPAQKKLCTIESQRVLSVVVDTTQRLEVALRIPSLVEARRRLSVPLGSDLVKLLQEFGDLTAEVETVTACLNSIPSSSTHSRSQSSCSSADSSVRSGAGQERTGGDIEEQFYSLQQRIRHNVKSTLRAVSTNPAVLQAVKNERTAAIWTRLMETLQGLQSVSNEMLLTTKTEEKKRKEHLQVVAERRLSTEENIRRLEAKLETAQKQKDDTVCTLIFSVPSTFVNVHCTCLLSITLVVRLLTRARSQSLAHALQLFSASTPGRRRPAKY